LTFLDISQNTTLEFLYCYNNQLGALDVTNNPNLIYIFCHSNQIEALDVSQNLQLVSLYCQSNLISSLDLSANTELIAIACNNNSLEYLNINNGFNTDFSVFYAQSNPNLSCIQVDDVSYANSLTCANPNPIWCKDDTAEYSEDCDNLSVE